MHVEAGILGQPGLNVGMFVGGVVVGDQVQWLVLGGLSVDPAQERQPLDMGVVRLAMPID